MRILLLRFGAFGDILHTMPLAADLAAAGHTVEWWCEDRWASVVEGSPVVHRVHRFPRRLLRDRQAGWRTRCDALMTAVRQVRAGAYDVVVDAQGLAKSGLLARAVAGPGVVVGHAPPRARELAWCWSDRHQPTTQVHVIDQQRDIGRLLGVPVAGPWRFPLPAWPDADAAMGAWLAARGLQRPWMLNVGAGWPTKVWPEACQAEFLREAQRCGQRVVVLWGSAAERQVAERIIAAASHGDLAPPTDLPQLLRMIAHGGVLVSGDTGPLHGALAVGTPAIGLFGPVPHERNGPRGRGYQNFQAPGAAWERRDVRKVDMGAIAPATVAVAAAAMARSHSA